MMKYLASVLLMCLTMVTSVGCRGSAVGQHQNKLYTNAETIRQNTETVKVNSEQALSDLEQIRTNLLESTQTLANVLNADTPIDVAQPIQNVITQNADTLALRESVATKVHAIRATTKATVKAADGVTNSANHVQDVVSFWEKLGASVRNLIVIALLCLITIVAWRFGLDRIIKSLFSTLSTGINAASNWAFSKYDGPVKLIKEGKTSEGLAALRSILPDLDEVFKNVRNK